MNNCPYKRAAPQQYSTLKLLNIYAFFAGTRKAKTVFDMYFTNVLQNYSVTFDPYMIFYLLDQHLTSLQCTVVQRIYTILIQIWCCTDLVYVNYVYITWFIIISRSISVTSYICLLLFIHQFPFHINGYMCFIVYPLFSLCCSQRSITFYLIISHIKSYPTAFPPRHRLTEKQIES